MLFRSMQPDGGWGWSNAGLELTCPKHKWAFDLATGACVKKGTLPLKRFDAKVEKGRLLAYW